MTRTDTDPYADEQDPPPWTEDDDAPWDGPLCECPQCEENCRREYERARARAWDEARQASPHD